MKHRSYNQYCGLAYALEIVGERWTLLIVRELVAGPRRFKDLLDGLPGISTNLLAERLKHLEQQGLIGRRTLPAPAGSTVYELTALGAALEPTVLELGRWGSQFVPPTPEGATVLRPGSYALTLKTFFRPDEARGLDESYALQIDDEALDVRISDGAVAVRQGDPANPAVTLRASMQAYMGLLQGALDPEQAAAAGEISVEGDPAALRRFLRCCGLP
ncbi:MAG TPA: winged helix-turn-helix transcriptional regulator, partial [Herpetosiphonaceae bacterium]